MPVCTQRVYCVNKSYQDVFVYKYWYYYSCEHRIQTFLGNYCKNYYYYYYLGDEDFAGTLAHHTSNFELQNNISITQFQ